MALFVYNAMLSNSILSVDILMQISINNKLFKNYKIFKKISKNNKEIRIHILNLFCKYKFILNSFNIFMFLYYKILRTSLLKSNLFSFKYFRYDF